MILRLIKKTLILFCCILTLSSSFITTNFSYAAENANALGRAMMNFFRQTQTELDPASVSDSELLVYGVFISNFFIPGKTTLKDLVKMEGDESIPNRISLKFFGTGGENGNANQVLKLNEKLLKGIKDGFRLSNNYFGLFSTGKLTDASVPMSGEDLLKKLAGLDSDGKIYNSQGVAVLDFKNPNNQAAKGAFQILFGVMPDFVLSPSGLKSMKHLYMDGLGNIWGAYEKDGALVSLDDYVLVFPAALNPAVFNDNIADQRLPLNNVFAMGGIVKLTDPYILSNKHFAFPYYNLKEALTTGSAGSHGWLNRENFMSIFGIESASRSYKAGGSSYPAVGNTNGVFFHATEITSNPIADGALQRFLNSNDTTTFSEYDSAIILTFDASKFGNLNLYFDEKNKDTVVFSDNDARSNLFSYLFSSSVFSFSQISDMMYYFDLTGMGSSYKGASGDNGSWFKSDSIDNLVIGQRMFAEEIKSETGSSYKLYNNSYVSSPFNIFMKNFYKSLDEGTSYSYLLDYINTHNGRNISKGSGTSVSFDKFMADTPIDNLKGDLQNLKALHSFLATGKFGTDKEEIIDKALNLLSDADGDKFVMDTLPPSHLSLRVMLEKLGFWASLFSWLTGAKDDKTHMSWALTEYDSILSKLSLNYLKGDDFKVSPTDGNSLKGFTPNSNHACLQWSPGPFPVCLSEQEPEGKQGGLEGILTDLNKEGKTYLVPDNLQNSIAVLLNTALSYRLFSVNSTFAEALTPDLSESALSLIPGEKVEGLIGTYNVETAIINGVNNYPGIFWGYMVDLLDITEDSIKNNAYLQWQNELLLYMPIESSSPGFNIGDAIGSTGVVASEEKTMEEMQKDIVKKVYGLLTDGPSAYRDKLVKSTQDSWIISTHRSITGSWVGNVLSVSAGGNHSYASIVGYINSPSLHDLPLTSWLLDDYMYVYLFFYILILVMVILMAISHIRSLREGVLILILMAFILLLPQFFVGNVINISNSFGDKIYSSRFDYWAITQHQQSFETLLNAQSSGDELNYIIAQNAMSLENVYTTDVGVRVKWMAPKREGVFDSLFTEGSPASSLTSNLTVFRWLFNSFLSQQEYVFNDPLATYLYRPYNAIAEEARASYESLEAFDESVISLNKVASNISTHSNKVMGLPSHRFMLFNSPEGLVPYSDEQKELISRAAVFPTSESGVFDDKLNRYRFWALGNENVTKAIFNSEFTLDPTVSGISGDLSNPFYKAYVLSTESPFYYFYNVFKMRYSSGTSGLPDFKSALLKREVFQVENSGDPRVDGKLRDFLDLEGLFKYVIPYLHQGNEYVDGWTARFGTDVQGFDFDNAESSASLGQSSDFQFQQKKKQTLKNVWNLYAPWVDQLYDLDSVSQEIEIAGKKVYLDDTLNPGAYELLGRSMIFSPADMAAKSYHYGDLTDVERRIQATLEATYKDLLYLTNYRDFDNEVLITAAAMAATFNFNREFSEYKFLGESSILYPQNFELKNFNYDAFMRLLLLNATGEPLMADKDLYVRILDKTSFFTGLVLLACDIMAVFAVPAFKVIVLLLLLLLSFVIAVSCVLSPPPKIVSVILKNLGLPAVLFMVASTIFAFVISLFMGEGQTAYVGGRVPSLGLTDPTIMMSLMLVVDVVYLYVLWRIIKLLLDSFKVHLSTTFASSVALFASAGAMLKQMSGRVLGNTLGTLGPLGTIGYGVYRLAKFGNKRRKFNKIHDAVENVGGVSSSPTTSSAGGSGGARGSRGGFKSRSTKFSKSSGGFGQEDIDALASKPVYNESKPSPSIQKRSIGERVIDFKYGVRDKYRDVRDSVSEFSGSVKSTKWYIRSKTEKVIEHNRKSKMLRNKLRLDTESQG
ncbi:hypothetical protein NYE69_26315 [Paenibacillus sp. FSL R5-0527]|uniref:hypothetical protein n=1 Tax=Paenibacillus sp. FSL R5-0527 TaxID=2975321 RepID=UPI00097A4B71|nr:hypothetical protein BK140_10440 [Paenibacillus macerans]